MQLEGVVSFMMLLFGDLVGKISNAIALFGNDVLDNAQDEYWVEAVANGIFGTDSGLIYWINDKIIYLLNNLVTGEFGANLGNFLQNLLGWTF